MTAKIIKGNDFRGVINYIMDEKKRAVLIDFEGVRVKNKDSIITSFNMQNSLNPEARNPVYHISLNFSTKDKSVLNREKMAQIAREYMKEMGFVNTQYIVVRHFDREHPHIHLCINRIDNEGKAISDKYDRNRSVKVCKMLTEKHSLYLANGKDEVKRHRLKGADKIKYEIYDALVDTVPRVKSWNELEKQLAKQGVSLTFKYRGKTSDIQGIVFSKDNYHFTGSKVDRRFSYSKINQQFEQVGYSIVLTNKQLVDNGRNDRQVLLKIGQELLSILSSGEDESIGEQENKKDIQRRRKGIRR